ncbi:MAG: alkaline phosphatase family protein, partial [Planctomycetes bacterium]|nr:alkaline phosphatase family protein [Planctomycetota bacterium]
CMGCGKKAEPEARVLFIGLDGLEVDVMLPLLEKGELPHLAKLIDRGVFGYLRTYQPTFSPVIWTTIATGKNIDDHRITYFVDPSTGGPFTSNARRGKAIWNIVGDDRFGLQCNVTGYWITYPAEKIDGYMVSQVITQEQVDDVWKGMLYKDVKNATYPEDFLEELWPVVEPFQTQEFLQSKVLPEIFGDVKNLNPSFEVQKLITQSNWSFIGDYMYFEAAKYLLDHYPADLDIVYLGGTDVIAHRFWRYRQPDLYTYKISNRYIEAFGAAIDAYYKLTDRMVGELVARVPESTRVVIVSDHGMHADYLDGKDKNGNKQILSAHHMDAPPGILIAAGEGIQKGPGVAQSLDPESLAEMGTVFDITPTLLYLLDIPVGRNMKLGRVMRNVVDPDLLARRPVEHIDSHDTDFRPPTSSRTSRKGDKAFLEKFAALGYIDAAGGETEVPDFQMGPGKKKSGGD